MILGTVFLVLGLLVMSLNVLQRYLSAKSYDPLGLDPTAIRVKDPSRPNIRWIAVPIDFSYIFTPHSTGNRVLDILASDDAHLVGRGRTARGAVEDMVQRHIDIAEEIDLT